MPENTISIKELAEEIAYDLADVKPYDDTDEDTAYDHNSEYYTLISYDYYTDDDDFPLTLNCIILVTKTIDKINDREYYEIYSYPEIDGGDNIDQGESSYTKTCDINELIDLLTELKKTFTREYLWSLYLEYCDTDENQTENTIPPAAPPDLPEPTDIPVNRTLNDTTKISTYEYRNIKLAIHSENNEIIITDSKDYTKIYLVSSIDFWNTFKNMFSKIMP